MNHLIDVHTVLATPDDLADWHDDPYTAADNLNIMLHHLCQIVQDDTSAARFDKLSQEIWEYWCRNVELAEIDDIDLLDWVDQLAASWDDADQ